MEHNSYPLHQFMKESQELGIDHTTISEVDSVVGQFHNDSLVVEVGYSDHETVDSFGYLTGLESASALERYFGKYDTQSIDIERAIPALTYMHEHEHYVRMQSTSTGLYLWRIMHALNVDIRYLQVLNLRGIYSGRVNIDDISKYAAVFQEQYSSEFDIESLKKTKDYFTFVCWEICVLRRHLINLLDGRGVTKGEFVYTARIADGLLMLRSETPIRREVQTDSPDELLLQQDDLTLLEIFEMSAVVSEEHFLIAKKCDAKCLDQWAAGSCHGIYKRANDFALASFGNTGVSQLAADIALSGPIDIACDVGTFDVDDIHPSLRLRKLRNFARENFTRLDVAWESMKDDVFPTKRIFGLSEIDTAISLTRNPLWSNNFIGNSASQINLSGPENFDGKEELEEGMRKLAELTDKLAPTSALLFELFFRMRASGNRPARKDAKPETIAPLTLYRGSIGVNFDCLDNLGHKGLGKGDSAFCLLAGLLDSTITKGILYGNHLNKETVQNIKQVAPAAYKWTSMTNPPDIMDKYCPSN